MHMIHTVEESRWGKSSRRTAVVHIISEPSDCFLQERGGLNSVHSVTSSHSFIYALFFHRVGSFPLTCPSFFPSPSLHLLLPLSCQTFSCLHLHPSLPLLLVILPWQHPLVRGGEFVKRVGDKSLDMFLTSGWVCWFQICGKEWLPSPLSVSITRHCNFTGYILPPAWETDVWREMGSLF